MKDSKAYSWVASIGGRAGQRTDEDDEDAEHASLIHNTAIRGPEIILAGYGRIHSVLGSKAV